ARTRANAGTGMGTGGHAAPEHDRLGAIRPAGLRRQHGSGSRRPLPWNGRIPLASSAAGALRPAREITRRRSRGTIGEAIGPFTIARASAFAFAPTLDAVPAAMRINEARPAHSDSSPRPACSPGRRYGLRLQDGLRTTPAHSPGRR